MQKLKVLRQSQGFSLVEVIISMMLLGLVSLCLMTAFTFAVANTARAGSKRQAMAVAQTAIERAEAGASYGSPEYMGGREFRVSSSGSIPKVEVILAGGVDKLTVFGTTTAVSVKDDRGTSVPLRVFVPTSVDASESGGY